MTPTSVTMNDSSIAKASSHVTSEIPEILARCRTVEKKRTAAASGEDVVHPATGECRVRLAHGRRPGDVQVALRSSLPGGVHGRDEQATGWGGACPQGGRSGASPVHRLRI